MATNPTQTSSDSENYRKDVAGRFFQTTAAITFDLFRRWFPENAAQVEDVTRTTVEEQGKLEEGVAVILHWFRSDADAEWLEAFANSPEGRRFLQLTVEIFARANLRQNAPHVPVPSVGES
jgi:hypothetical protein